MVLALIAVAGCGWQSGDTRIDDKLVARAGVAVVEGCVLDPNQDAPLATAAARRVLDGVVLLCVWAQPSGALSPVDVGATQKQIDQLRARGYRVTLGITIGDLGSLTRLDSVSASALLWDETWRARVESAITSLPLAADGWELALPRLTDDAQLDVDALVDELQGLRPLGVLIPPSVRAPSDVPGGDAYDLNYVGARVDRLRVMTLDFSIDGPPAGPTIDSGWAVDAARFAAAAAHHRPGLDVAVPLYGTDFAPDGTSRSITWVAANALLAQSGAQTESDVTGARHFGYRDAQDGFHTVWFDDARSTLRTLSAWSVDALDAKIGVVFYGLGAEDPATWTTIAEALP
jgi:hypothetical protein